MHRGKSTSEKEENTSGLTGLPVLNWATRSAAVGARLGYGRLGGPQSSPDAIRRRLGLRLQLNLSKLLDDYKLIISIL